ncbi:D-glycero-alpha-D-manno-heptose-1,7-bisphosphate 7-phosphatase [Streptomyces sp. NPDC002990]
MNGRLPPTGPAQNASAASTADGPWLSGGLPCAPARGPSSSDGAAADPALPAAVLFDRDGTLVVDVPYNGDPRRVLAMPSARQAVAAVTALGIPVGVVSNQSGVARGLLTRHQVDAVRRRVDALMGPFAVWAVCPHGPDDGCHCRKPAPGLVLAACARLRVPAGRTVVIGDIGADMEAARAAGARGILVPTALTRPDEVRRALETAPDLLAAVRLVLNTGADDTDTVRTPSGVR